MKFISNTGRVYEVQRTPCRHYRMRLAGFTEKSKWVRVSKRTANHVRNTMTPLKEIELSMSDVRGLML